MLLPALLLIGGAITAGLWALLSQADEKATVRASLRQLDGYEVDNMRDAELLVPMKDRALMPIFSGLTSLGRRFTPVGYVDGVRRKFSSLGLVGNDSVDRFLAMRVITIAVVPVAFVGVYLILGMRGMIAHAIFIFVSVICVIGPDSSLKKKVDARKNEIRLALPDVLDLLVISVEAGLGFEQALDRTVSAVPGALTEEFARMLGEVRAGSGRGDAMRALDKRADVPELRSFVLAIIQADTFGVSIGRVLRAQADEMRVKRKQMAQEQAQKAPVKMLIPMVFCVFPALFVVVIGPAMINIGKSF
jgi:tight adherence protein C